MKQIAKALERIGKFFQSKGHDKSVYDLVGEILQKTNDGDDLAPCHLKFLENGINGYLSEKGEVFLYQLHEQVMKGYKKPWYHGIEHMTQDHEGYIYWKGKQVEHYSHEHYEDADRDAKELAERCKLLEKNGLKVSSMNAIWNWKDIVGDLKV